MDGAAQVPFQAHVDLLQLFLGHRGQIVERLQELLNAQKQPVAYLQDGITLAGSFEACYFNLAAVGRDQSLLADQLEEAHWANGFQPREVPGNDLVDPVEMMIRAFHLWQQTRWPGRNGRLRYAHTLFDLYLLRCLELLVMRVWDAGPDRIAQRLSQVQGLMNDLWKDSPADQPVLVRDVRWLIPVAQSPTTNELSPYFEVAQRVAESPSEDDRLEIQKAGVLMAGGHLRSQLRHYCIREGVSLEENGLVLSARNSNALDFAITIESLVPLLGAYERAIAGGGEGTRREFANAICQGLSADPELFVNRLDLLGPYTMIEYLFIETCPDGQVVYTPMGRRHVQLLEEYKTRISRLAQPLFDDLPQFRPVAGSYSPYGLIYGFSSNLTEHMALKTLEPDASTGFALEDVFTDGGADKLAWVSGWRKLPHIRPEVQKQFEYPQKFAEDIFGRIVQALRIRSANEGAGVASGRLFIPCADEPQTTAERSDVPDLSPRYVASSDPGIVATGMAHSQDEGSLLHDRQEGMFAVSYKTAGGWVAITKDIFTEVLGAGRDVRVTGLPDTAAKVLRLMCPELARTAKLT